jgi:hypothetical protein
MVFNLIEERSVILTWQNWVMIWGWLRVFLLNLLMKITNSKKSMTKNHQKEIQAQ